MLKRIKKAVKIWQAARHENVFVVKEKLRDEQIKEIEKSLPGGEIVAAPEELGDGKAVFFSDPTHEDQIDFDREEAGEKPWYDRVLKKLI